MCKPEGFVPVSLEPDPVIEAYKKDIDRTLLIENLKLTPTERIQRLMELLQFAESLSEAGKRLRKDANVFSPNRQSEPSMNQQPDFGDI